MVMINSEATKILSLGKINVIKNGAVAVIPDNTPLAASCTPTPLSQTISLKNTSKSF